MGEISPDYSHSVLCQTHYKSANTLKRNYPLGKPLFFYSCPCYIKWKMSMRLKCLATFPHKMISGCFIQIPWRKHMHKRYEYTLGTRKFYWKDYLYSSEDLHELWRVVHQRESQERCSVPSFHDSCSSSQQGFLETHSTHSWREQKYMTFTSWSRWSKAPIRITQSDGRRDLVSSLHTSKRQRFCCFKTK